MRQINGKGKRSTQFSGPNSHVGWRARHFLEVRKGKESSSVPRLCRTGSDLGSMLEKSCRNT